MENTLQLRAVSAKYNQPIVLRELDMNDNLEKNDAREKGYSKPRKEKPNLKITEFEFKFRKHRLFIKLQKIERERKKEYTNKKSKLAIRPKQQITNRKKEKSYHQSED